MDERLAAAAAANNASWCASVCRLVGIEGTREHDAWTSAVRTPDHYPDAVTLRSMVEVPRLLARIDASTGCSIKDSFADLDLESRGFGVLFDAQWLQGPADAAKGRDSAEWAPVRDANGLSAWNAARVPAVGEGWAYPDGILAAPSVVVAAGCRDGEIVAGAVLCAADGVVGLANVFATDGRSAEAFSGAAAAVARWLPGKPVVGYETGDDLESAREAGYEPIGPLRVWLKG